MHMSSAVRSLGFASNGACWFRAMALVVLGSFSLLFSGCASGPVAAGAPAKVIPDVQVLNPGDVIRIAFPGSPSLDTSQQIRRDGRINLAIVGELKVTEKTPAQLEAELLKAYDSQLVSKEIKVTLVSSAYSVYVQGAVMKPGKVTPERALTAFDAVMEAGGFTPTANPKKVIVIRQEDGQVKTYPLDMKKVLNGEASEPFYLKAYDTVSVPEKISWF